MRRLRLLACGAALTVACTGGSPESGPTPSYRRDVITQDEIQASAQRATDLYVAIQSLRPQFFAAPAGVRPAGAAKTVIVYVNGTRQPGIESLKTLLAANVSEVRYLDPMKSQVQFGPIAGAGAILVTLASPGRDPAG